MSGLYEAVLAALAKGPRTADDVAAECRRAGLVVRPQTVELFLRLCRGCRQCDGAWSMRVSGKTERILAALQQAFAAGGAYVPVDRLARFLGDAEPVTVEDIDAACRDSALFRRQGMFILRS